MNTLLYFTVALLLTALPFSVSIRFPREHPGDDPLTEVQKGLLEEIQVLARKAGLPESELDSITKYDEDVCYTVDCLESAIEVMTATNFSVNPCNPKMWLEFACARRVNGPDNINQLERLLRLVEKQTIALLDDHNGTYEDDFLLKEAQTHYHQCKHKSHADDQDVKDIMAYSEQYGNWPILTNKDPGEKFNWMDMVADLNRIERFSYTPYLFHVNVPEFGKEDGPIQLTVSPALLQVTTGDLKKMLALVQTKIGRNKPVRTEQIVKIAGLMARALASSILLGSPKPITIADLQNKTDKYLVENKVKFPVNWLSFFTRALKGAEAINVTPNLTVSTSFNQVMDLIQTVDMYLSSKDKNTAWAVANLLHFQLVSTLLQESTTLLDRMNSFKCSELSGGDSKEFCLARVKDVFGYSLGATYVKKHYDDKFVTPAVEQLVADIKKGYTEVVRRTKWMENGTKEFLMDKINSIRTYIAYPEWIKSREKLEEFFKGLELSTDRNSSYPKNYLAMSTWRLQKKRSWSYSYSNLTDWKGFHLYDVDWNHYPAAVQAQYHKAINEARIDVGIIQKPIFGNDRPGFMNYGGLSMILAHEIGHSFDIVGRYFSKDGKREKEYWDEASLKKYYEWIKQIAQQYGSEPYRISDSSEETIDPMKTLNEDIADILAVYISYHSYNTYLKELKKKGESEKILPGLKGFSSQKLFYMKYANMWCDNKDVQDKYRDMLSDHSSGNTRATLPLMYSKQFARAFGCKLTKREA